MFGLKCKKYRIVKFNDKYFTQKRYLFFFWECIGDYGSDFKFTKWGVKYVWQADNSLTFSKDSLDEAKHLIHLYKNYIEKLNVKPEITYEE